MASVVSGEKSVGIHIVVTLYVTSHFSLAAFQIQSPVSLVRAGLTGFSLALGCTELCESLHLSFVRFGIFSIILLKIFFTPISFSFCWESN